MRWLSGSPIWYHCFSAGRIRSQDHGMWPLVNSSRISGTVCAVGWRVFLTPWVYVSVYILITILYIYLFINIITFLESCTTWHFSVWTNIALLLKHQIMWYFKRWLNLKQSWGSTVVSQWYFLLFIYFTLHVGCTTWLRFGWTKFYIYIKQCHFC